MLWRGRRGDVMDKYMTAMPSSEPSPTDKTERYRALADEIDAVLEGEPDRIARMASVAAMLAARFDHFLWTGFYVLVPARDGGPGDELVVGPYQGALGCLRIEVGRGVCGAAAARRVTVIVADVDAFDGHIACDSRARSEIVVPVFDGAGTLIAVLDVDSARLAAFDEADGRGLEEIVRRVFAT
jgi:GAF domain-containing protein